MTCSDCEYFGCYKKGIYSEKLSESINDTGLKTYHKEWLDFDVSKGADCRHEKLKGRIIIYDDSPACRFFLPKTWTKNISSCSECILFHWRRDDIVSCSGFPFTSKVGLAPCRNGRAKLGEQIMFDLG